MTEFEARAVIDKVNRMFKSNHFCICDLDNLMKVTGAVRNSEYNALRLYHCVHYSEMDKQTKEFVFQAAMSNVCNVAEFPEIRLHDPAAAMIETIQPSSETGLQRLFMGIAKRLG